MAVHFLIGHKYVTFRSLWVGSVTFLQYHKSVPHMVVHKIDPEVGPDHFPPPTPFHQALNRIKRLQEGNLVVLGLLLHVYLFMYIFLVVFPFICINLDVSAIKFYLLLINSHIFHWL